MDTNVSLEQHPNYPQIVVSARREGIEVWSKVWGRNV